MDVLQKAMEEALANHYPGLLTDLIIRKFVEQGIELSAVQKGELRTILAAGDLAGLNNLMAGWTFPGRDSNEDIVIEITDEDAQGLEAAAQGFMERIPETIESMGNDLAADILTRLKRDWPREARLQRAEAKGFRNRLQKRWGAAFNLLEMFLTIAVELGESMNERLRKEKSGRSRLVEVQTRLHARACQVTSEIVTLLRNGFADGAMARWRTLHEIAVVSYFIGKHGEEVAERYLLHEAMESRRAARQYQQYAHRLGYEPLSQEEIEALEKKCEWLENRFGKAYKEEYGWAWEQFHPQKPTFALMEQAVGTDHLRPFFRLACHNVHANPKGVLFKLGLVDGSPRVLLVGASNYGLADPGQNAALSLMQVTSSLSSLDPTLDIAVAQKLMLNLSREIGETFVAIQKGIEEETKNAPAVGDDQYST